MMNELRLKYQFETGIRIIPDELSCELDLSNEDSEGIILRVNGVRKDYEDEWTVFPEEYVEWLEEQLTDANAVNDINSLLIDRKIPIFYNHEKDKKTSD